MTQYNVTGMSCAACSARVEKAVSKVPGVTSCSVSLLTNSMGVEGTASDKAIISAVQKAGYGASKKGGGKAAESADESSAPRHGNTKAQKASVLVRRISYNTDVFFDGSYDVGMATPLFL